VVDEGSGEVRKESSPRRTGIFRLPKIANSVISGAALLIAGALWIGLDAEPGWPGWFGTAAGLLIIVRAGVGEKG
jgi:hypothetical protein